MTPDAQPEFEKQSTSSPEAVIGQNPVTKRGLQLFTFLFGLSLGFVAGVILVIPWDMSPWLEDCCGLGFVVAGYKLSVPRFLYFGPLMCGFGVGMLIAVPLLTWFLSGIRMC